MSQEQPSEETYNPWTIVNVVFEYLVKEGLHPTLGDAGPPGEPAAELLRTLGIAPTLEGDARIAQGVHAELAQLRATMLDQG